MGTHQFQREYIEYLQERNTELVNKLNQMKQNYDSRIFCKGPNKHYLNSIIDEIVNVCSSLPRDIDLFFDEMTAAMSTFKNILIKKAEMVQLVDKITEAIDPDIISSKNSFTMEQAANLDGAKKASTVKVSPMINGHIISTDSKIYLNRLSYNSSRRNNGSLQLSPIIEASPITPNSSKQENYFIKPTDCHEKLNKYNFTYNFENESPSKSKISSRMAWKSNFRPKSEEKTLQVEQVLFDNEEDIKMSKVYIQKNDAGESCENDVDPLEGPSWLYNDHCDSNSPAPNENDNYLDFRRRKHRFAALFDRDKPFADELIVGESPAIPTDKNDLSRDSNDLNVLNEEESNTVSPYNVCQNITNENARVSFENTPALIQETPPSHKNKKKIISIPKEEVPTKGMPLKEPVIKLEDCMADKHLKNFISTNSNPRNKKKENSSIIKKESFSCLNESGENLSRKKRRAAPKNLCEPKLITKMRRD